jgi:hypothetical protein
VSQVPVLVQLPVLPQLLVLPQVPVLPQTPVLPQVPVSSEPTSPNPNVWSERTLSIGSPKPMPNGSM